MTSNKRLIMTTLMAVAAGAVVFVSTALGAKPTPTLFLVAHNRGLVFITASGSTTAYPGHLQPGDRILARDALMTQSNRPVGYDDELCTLTFDSKELCQDTMALTGKGQIQANWLWSDWPSAFTGAIAGGTGIFAHAKGQFTATPLAGGALRITASLN